jgi:hypothetical protein
VRSWRSGIAGSAAHTEPAAQQCSWRAEVVQRGRRSCVHLHCARRRHAGLAAARGLFAAAPQCMHALQPLRRCSAAVGDVA